MAHDKAQGHSQVKRQTHRTTKDYCTEVKICLSGAHTRNKNKKKNSGNTHRLERNWI